MNNERKIRVEFENKLVRLKEQYAKKDLQVADLEFKENTTLNTNQDLMLENERLRNELSHLEDVSRTRITELEGRLDSEGKNADEAGLRYDSEFQRFKKEGLEYIDNLIQ